MRHHFRHPQAMFNKGSLFYSHCDPDTAEPGGKSWTELLDSTLVVLACSFWYLIAVAMTQLLARLRLFLA
jgi:hypothetical protein